MLLLLLLLLLLLFWIFLAAAGACAGAGAGAGTCTLVGHLLATAALCAAKDDSATVSAGNLSVRASLITANTIKVIYSKNKTAK